MFFKIYKIRTLCHRSKLLSISDSNLYTAPNSTFAELCIDMFRETSANLSNLLQKFPLTHFLCDLDTHVDNHEGQYFSAVLQVRDVSAFSIQIC